jgi:isoaspartyl peptidase/L-asparaginase-like protein (Ntn-hydrolase superfamily)
MLTIDRGIRIVLHGGAGANPERDYSIEIEHMSSLIRIGADQLQRGAAALDVATETVAALEASGLYIAGRGSSPNSAGRYELDACIMDGEQQRAGAVAALQGVMSPIRAARCVMERTPHVLLAGEGAQAFAQSENQDTIVDAPTWFTVAGRDEANYLPEASAHGTVGCVVRDAHGRLAAATSTGGVFGKLAGRCGDTPLVGAGTWADAQVAVSCTGLGEYFIRVAAAAQLGHRLRWAAQDLREAADATLDEVKSLGGSGGLIAVDGRGNIAMPFVSTGMKRAALLADGSVYSQAF